MKRIGSQTRETIEEAGYKFLGYLGDDKETIVLQANGDPTQKEVWQLNDHHAGYTVEFEGNGFEFVRDYKAPLDGMLWLETPPLTESEKRGDE